VALNTHSVPASTMQTIAPSRNREIFKFSIQAQSRELDVYVLDAEDYGHK